MHIALPKEAFRDFVILIKDDCNNHMSSPELLIRRKLPALILGNELLAPKNLIRKFKDLALPLFEEH